MSSSTFPATLEKLPDMLEWVRQVTAEAGLTSRAQKQVEVALEEALVNIIRYAYAGKSGDIALSCTSMPEKQIEFTIKDRGVAFNPLLQRPAVDIQATLEERKEGGLGVFLMHTLMDAVTYERKEPFNILFLMKKVEKVT